MLRRLSHISLKVPSLRKAEEHYVRLFDLTVAYREISSNDGWYTLPDGSGWDAEGAWHLRIARSVLFREGFVLSLEARDRVVPGDRLDRIGLEGDEGEIRRLERLVWGLGGQVLSKGGDSLLFEDAYAVRWEVSAGRFADPWEMSLGVRAGRWFRDPNRG